MSKPPSMADVAAVAGVSHQTVSRVVNHKGAVREQTRERVERAIAELGYRRNEAARALASNESRLLGVVTPRFVEWGPAVTLLSVQLAANRAGYFVSVGTLPEFTDDAFRTAIDDLLSLGVAGLIVIAPVEAMAKELEDQQIPVPTLVISSGWVNEDSRFARLGIDQRSGVAAALNHLKAVGCESVGHIAGPADNFDAMERYEAWLAHTAELGMRLGPCVRGDWSAQSGYEATRTLLKEPLPDAIFVANDQMSLGALKALTEAGVAVPDQVRLVGFDDQDGVEFFEPALTTVKQDFEGLGEGAIQALTQIIAGKKPDLASRSTELIIRVSA